MKWPSATSAVWASVSPPSVDLRIARLAFSISMSGKPGARIVSI